MKRNPLVSIIINNYNYGRFLRDAIESAMAQTYLSVEIIVVDDGSQDDSREIIKSYTKMIVPVFKTNGGQASSFNAGFKSSKGDIILFLDADDYLAPNAVEHVVKEWDDIAIVKIHWPLIKVDRSGKSMGKMVPNNDLAKGDLRDQIIKGGPSQSGGPPHSPPTSGNAWTRNFLEKVLPIPEKPFRIGADDYLFLLAPLYGTIRRLDQPYGYYRIHGSNDTLRQDYFTTFFKRFETCCEILSEHLAKQGINSDPAGWPRDHWYHLVSGDMHHIMNEVPADKAFVLVDDDHWMTGETVLGRRRILFTENNGQYWGPPVNDEAAIRELEHDRVKGASHIVFTWPSFWYLEHFKGLHDHLRSHYDCVLNSERMIIFELNSH